MQEYKQALAFGKTNKDVNSNSERSRARIRLVGIRCSRKISITA